jgi:hypothetical protein
MKLAGEDVELFYTLHRALRVFLNQREGVIPDVSTVEEFLELSVESKNELRAALYEHPETIEAFVDENPFRFSADDLAIVRGWNHFVKGEFYLFQYLKKYAIFLDAGTPPKAYGVVALTSEFQEVLGPEYPLYLKAVLLPFKGQIIYDGVLVSYTVRFGPGYRRDLKETYQEAKARFGIITTLPHEEHAPSDAELMKTYMSSDSLQFRHQADIDRLIKRNHSLLTVYHQEEGKRRARAIGRRLARLGLGNAWFALFYGEVIAGGSTRAEVEQIVDKLLPAEQRDFAYLFHLKGSMGAKHATGAARAGED